MSIDLDLVKKKMIDLEEKKRFDLRERKRKAALTPEIRLKWEKVKSSSRETSLSWDQFLTRLDKENEARALKKEEEKKRRKEHLKRSKETCQLIYKKHKEIEGSCGIYKITCKETGKCYIGQSKNIAARWRGHCERFPVDAFDYEILMTCEENDLNDLEVSMIEKHGSHLNGFNKTGGNRITKARLPTSEDDCDDMFEMMTTWDTQPRVLIEEKSKNLLRSYWEEVMKSKT